MDTSGIISAGNGINRGQTSFLRPVMSALLILLICIPLSGCGKGRNSNSAGEGGTMGESAADLSVNIPDLVAQNEDIFGWLYIPGTGVDYPILQRVDGDDNWYLVHDCTGAENGSGALFIEAGNLYDMCDFNTVIHGYGGKGGMFQELRNFSDRKYFDKHGQFYIIIDGNALTYEIWTAYERDDTSILRSYDLTEEEGCNAYLEDMKTEMANGALVREGWEDGVSADTFLVTLTAMDNDHPGRQFVVQGCLIGDQAGTIAR